MPTPRLRHGRRTANVSTQPVDSTELQSAAPAGSPFSLARNQSDGSKVLPMRR